MSDKINKNDVIEDKILSAFIDEAIEAEKRIKAFDDRLKSLAETIRNDLSKSTDLNIDNLQKLNALEKEAEKRVKQKKQNVKDLSVVEQERLKIQKAVEKAQAQKTLADSKENKELQQLRAEKNKINKATRDEIKQSERARNAYTRLNDASKGYKDESKRLGARLIELEQAGKKNTKGFNDLEKEYKDVTRQAQLTDAQLKKLDKTVGDGWREVGNYENATSKLTSGLKMLAGAAGLGALVSGLGSVTKELSRAENQARLFFNTSQEGTKEIAQEAVILAKVFDKDVNEVLRTANSLSKQFGVDGQEALNLINQGFEKGGDVSGDMLSNIQEYSTNLKLAGLNAEESIAIITQSQKEGVFSDKGVDAVHEATLALREMPKVTAEALDALDMSAEDVQKSIADGSKTYFDVIQEISAKLNEVGEDAPQTGLAMADIFKGAGEEAGDFILKLSDLNINLEDLEDQNQGLEGAIQNLTKEFYTLVFGVEDALDVNNRFASLINFVAENLSTIIGVIGRVIGYWALYRIELMAVRSAKNGLLRGIFDTIKALPGMIRGLKGASFSFKNLGRAMKSIPFIAVIAGIVELVNWLWNSEEATEAQTEAERRLNDEMERGAKIRADRINSQREINELVEKRRGLSQSQLKSLRDEIQAEIELAESADKNIKLAKDRIQEAQITQDINQQKIDDLKEQLTLTRGNTIAEQQEREAIQFKIDLLIAENTEIEQKQRLAKEGIQLDDDELKNLALRKEQLALILPLIKENTRTKKDDTDADKKAKEAQERYNKALESSLRIRQLINDIEATEVGGALNEAGRATEGAIESEVEAIENGNYSILLSYQERISALNDVIDTEIELRKLNAENAFEFNRSTLESEKERIESKKELSEEDVARIREINLEIELLEIEHQQEMNDITREGEEKKLDAKKRIDDLLLEADKEQKAKEKQAEEDARKESEEARKELYQTINTAQENLTKVYSDHVDRRIALAQKEIESQKELRSILKAQAEAGNIDAQDSIKATIEAEREKEAEIIRLEKRKQQVQMISQGLQTYLNLLEGGEKPAMALAKTAITSQGLISLLSGLQGFWTGTDYAPEGLALTQEKGAEIITDKHGKIKSLGSDDGAKLTYLNKGDKVKNATETTKFLNSFENLNNEQRMPKQDVAGNSYDIMLLGSKLDQVVKAVKSIPQSNSDFQTITKGFSVLTKTTNSGGDKHTHKHYLKR